MDRLTALFVAVIVGILAVCGVIVYNFGWLFLIRLILGIIFLGMTVVFAILFGILVYARSKYAILSLLGLLSSGYALYQCYTWNNPMHIVYIVAAYVLALIVGIWYISEPDLSVLERLRSAKALESSGNYKAAARKYEKKGDYVKAAECYLKAGMQESAAWCYERAEMYGNAAEIYERLARDKGESYYWKEAYEFYKKAGNLRKACECLEKYAEEEPWYWEDVAKLWEEVGDRNRAETCWRKALEYYIKEAKEEGVFWEDVAKIYEKLGEHEKAKSAWMKFAEYCEKEAEKDPSWWKHVAEAYEKLGMNDKAEEARKRYEEYRKTR
jgi:tetratricopeptide (TPR) repeat protein